jgi:predicted permease
MHRFLRWLTGRSLADAIAGDLAEERARRAMAGGPVRAAVWHWQAMAGIWGHAMRRRTLDGVREFGRPLLPGGGRRSLRHAARSLRRSPWYAGTVVAIVALSMTIATTAFAVVDGVLFKPLPYPDAGELYALSGVFDDVSDPPDRLVRMVSPRELNTWRAAVPGLRATLPGYSSIQLEDGSFARAVTVDRDFFDVFGVRLLMGGFDDSHYDRDDTFWPVVISHDLWRRRFEGDPDIVGRIVRSPARRAPTPPPFAQPPLQIVGVLDPDGFVPPLPGSADQWVRQRARIDALFPSSYSGEFGERIGIPFVRVVSEDVAAIEAALGAAAASDKALNEPDGPPAGRPASFGRYDDVELVPIDHLLTVRQRPVLALVFATALGLALMVMLNAGALAAVRAQQRIGELALRRSLGARSSDLLRDALAEQAWLVGAGVVLGLSVAPMLIDVVGRQLPPGLTLIKTLQMDWRAAAFAATLSAGMAAIVAALSVRYVVRHAAPGGVLAAGSSRTSAPAHLGRWLVAGQIGIAFGIVLGGVMFLTSLGRVSSEDPGIRTRNAVFIDYAFGAFTTNADQERFVARLRQVPGVAGAGAYTGVSFLENYRRPSLTFRDPDGNLPAEPLPSLVEVGIGFFEAAGVRVLDGRLPTDAEIETNAPVIVVTASLARRYWPDRRAVGQTLRARMGDGESAVIGVVQDVRFVALDTPSDGAIFAPLSLTRRGSYGVQTFVAFDGDPGPVLPRVFSAIAEFESSGTPPQVRYVDEALVESVSPRRISALAAAAFAACALVLVAVGLFGLVAQTTGWRTREMGIRLALGSTPSRITRLVVREQLVAVAGGTLAGAALAAALARFVGSYLYGVTAYDARMWSAAIVVVVATAAVAALVPAVRASRVDPVQALRTE